MEHPAYYREIFDRDGFAIIDDVYTSAEISSKR
jgi:hypothetical protein